MSFMLNNWLEVLKLQMDVTYEPRVQVVLREVRWAYILIRFRRKVGNIIYNKYCFELVCADTILS